MEGWAGFTDADLRKIKGSETQTEGTAGNLSKAKPAERNMRPSSSSQRRLQQQKRFPGAKPTSDRPAAPLDKSMMLSQPTPNEKKTAAPSGDTKLTGTGTGNSKKYIDGSTGSHGHSPEGSVEQSPDGSSKKQAPDGNIVLSDDEKEKSPEDKTDDLVVDEQEIFKHEQHTMESFQKQQKMIEELNKKKRQMLSQAIQDRSKKAKAESTKLISLQQELGRLDQLLTVDVSIIRDKIENACREFFEAQKRYDRAEKEFVESKMDLHKKMETKESLTEHLYTVIYQNEMRKSKKLAELMKKLEMVDDDEPEIIECEMPHPSLISPVQLPLGRYGQIGPIHSQPTSPTDLNLKPSQDSENTTDQQKADSSANQEVKEVSCDKTDTNQGQDSQIVADKNMEAENSSVSKEIDASLKENSDKGVTDNVKVSDTSANTENNNNQNKGNTTENVT